MKLVVDLVVGCVVVDGCIAVVVCLVEDDGRVVVVVGLVVVGLVVVCLVVVVL